MIIDHRTYDLKPGQLGAFLKLFAAEGLPILSEHMGEPIGYFITVVGPVNQVVHLWGYESISEMERRRDSRDADPRWHPYANKAASFFVAQRNKILVPAPFSKIH